jgi:hypothetical protein
MNAKSITVRHKWLIVFLALAVILTAANRDRL